ncbi:hypothetical protein KUV85_16840 [Nocardioides panacisoli]|uniref:hypothetical protein n=1 Tax=Nocardioides panacisoli TaxID=627624 RepID=UPI001C6391C5|nr:hypothetical protein [Nocardioides panacisoli]QYJ03966.1 hypothetical protein KUV85_16840 [Nocardioides panacisoli]
MLSWREDRSTIIFVVVAVLVVVLIALLAVWGSGNDGADDEALERRTPYSAGTDGNTELELDESEGADAADDLAGVEDPFDPALDAQFGTAQPPGGFSAKAPTRDYVLTTSSDAPMAGVVWRIVRTDHGEVRRNVRSTRGAATVTEPAAFGQVNVVAGPESGRVECTITVNGRVVDRQQASGPWAQVFCQG